MKYYDLLEEIKVKDSRGNLKVEFQKIGEVRGEIKTKIVSTTNDNVGLTTFYQKLFITNKIYLEMFKIGYKIDNYIIKSILDSNGIVVCMLE